MKVLFLNKKSLVGLKAIAMLFVLPLSAFAVPANAQNSEGRDWDNSKLLYGVHASLTANDVDIYYTTNTSINKYSPNALGFRMAVIGEYQPRRYFSLRTMPGVSLFNARWEPDNDAASVATLNSYKIESVLAEVPVDIKIYPFRISKRDPFRTKNWQPYIAAGLAYYFDFASLRKDRGDDNIRQLNTHDLRYIGSLGVNWYTPYCKIGFEIKTSYGLIQHSISDYNSLFFHSATMFSLGINIEA